MNMKRAFVVGACIALALLQPAQGGEAKEAKYTGKVLDSASKPVAVAKVRLYTAASDVELPDLRLVAEATTNAKGEFALAIPREVRPNEIGEVVAEKKGLALTWATVFLDAPKELTLTLAKPAAMSGRIVDDTGGPVPDARVRAYLVKSDAEGPQSIYGGGDFAALMTTTDANGAFAFASVPPEAVGEFVVQAPGKAPVFTLRAGELQVPFKYAAGMSDITITLPNEAVISGKVVDKGTDNGVAGVKVRATIDGGPSAVGPLFATSGADGSFRLESLGEGEYTLSAVTEPGKGDLIVSDLAVATRKGETASGVKVQVERVSLLVVKFTDARSGKLITSAGVRVTATDGSWNKVARTGNGEVQIRVPPGDYRIVEMLATGYKSLDVDEVLTVGSGETKTASYALEPETKLEGVVLDQKGAPVENAEVMLIIGNSCRRMKTDKDGKFNAPATLLSMGQTGAPQLFARDSGRNLSALLPVTDASKPVEMRLTPAWAVKGRVINQEGKPVAGANVALSRGAPAPPDANAPMLPSFLTEISDVEGRYEIAGAPGGSQYHVDVQANGYGADVAVFDLGEPEGAPYEVGEVKLLLADKLISGVVVDAQDKPVSKLYVRARGKGQRSNIAATDFEGKFSLTGLVDGNVTLSAQGGPEDYYGAIETQVGAQDVKLVVRPGAGVEPASLLGKALPDLKALAAGGAAWTAAMDEAKDRVILVLWYDSAQRPSRHALSALAQKQAALSEKNVAVFVVDLSGQKPDAAAPAQPGPAFPTALVTDKVDDTRTAWGVKALPWLILTDKTHVVRAEGFSIDELDAKLTEVQGQ